MLSDKKMFVQLYLLRLADDQDVGFAVECDEKSYIAKDIVPDGPASRSGIENGDRVLRYDLAQLRDTVEDCEPTKPVKKQKRGVQWSADTLDIVNVQPLRTIVPV